MNMRKLIVLMLSLLLAFSVCFAFVSCGETPADECTEHIDENGDGVCDSEGCGEAVNGNPDGDGEYFNENGELILFKNGAPTFNFVFGSDASGAVGSLLSGLAGELNELSSGGIKAYLETNKDCVEQDVEILAGTITTRGDEYKFNKYDLGHDGYIVKQVGTKIVVLGGSNDALKDAFNYLKGTVFGIMRNTPPFTDFVMSADKNCDKTVTSYKLTDVEIGTETIKGYTLVYQTSDRPAKTIATKIQDTLYKTAGIHLETKTGADALEGKKSIVIRTVDNDGVSDGFEVRIEDGNLYIECMYPLLFEESFDTIYNPILNTRGVGKFKETTTHLRTIYYEDYEGVDKTGKTNSIEGIIACHNYANANGHIVKALRSGTGTFLIKETGGKYAQIKTDTDWTGATFVVDDSFLTANSYSADRKAHIFYVVSDNTDEWYYPDAEAEDGTIEKLLSDLSGIDKDTFNEELVFDLGLNRDALVYIYNDNHRNYVRFGENADSGAIQQEFIYLKADGTVDKNTPLLYDYSDVTRILVSYVDDDTVSITGGTINTIANQLPRKYDYYTSRGICINRSNTVVDGLTHTIEGEGDTGAPYSGFLTITRTNNVTVMNTVLTGHKAYDLEGSEGSNTMGTYDLAPSSCNNTLLFNVTQTNFLIKDANGNDVPSVSNGYWGIMGGNDCKNLTYDTCRLTRYDSHRGTVNSTIINSDVSHIAVIGGGTLRIENSRVYMSSKNMNNLVSLRADYGATWNGELIIKNVEAVMHAEFSSNYFNLVNGEWNNSAYQSHDFGYDCYAPYKITVDNFKASSSKVKTVNIVGGGISDPQPGTLNTYHTTKEIYVYNNVMNYTYEKVYSSATLTEYPIEE